MSEIVPEWKYESAKPAHTAAYLEPAIHSIIPDGAGIERIIDLGCGNGYLLNRLAEAWGAKGVGVDASASGIETARATYPHLEFHQTESFDGLLGRIGEAPFDLVVSTEVVEHLYAPREWAACCFDCLRPGGRMLCSTPYHGWLKNVAIAVTDKFDAHVGPLWDGGHIKFWSPKTLRRLLEPAGFTGYRWVGAGRLPLLWMSFVAVAERPGAGSG